MFKFEVLAEQKKCNDASDKLGIKLKEAVILLKRLSSEEIDMYTRSAAKRAAEQALKEKAKAEKCGPPPPKKFRRIVLLEEIESDTESVTSPNQYLQKDSKRLSKKCGGKSSGRRTEKQTKKFHQKKSETVSRKKEEKTGGGEVEKYSKLTVQKEIQNVPKKDKEKIANEEIGRHPDVFHQKSLQNVFKKGKENNSGMKIEKDAKLINQKDLNSGPHQKDLNTVPHQKEFSSVSCNGDDNVKDTERNPKHSLQKDLHSMCKIDKEKVIKTVVQLDSKKDSRNEPKSGKHDGLGLKFLQHQGNSTKDSQQQNTADPVVEKRAIEVSVINRTKAEGVNSVANAKEYKTMKNLILTSKFSSKVDNHFVNHTSNISGKESLVSLSDNHKNDSAEKLKPVSESICHTGDSKKSSDVKKLSSHPNKDYCKMKKRSGVGRHTDNKETKTSSNQTGRPQVAEERSSAQTSSKEIDEQDTVIVAETIDDLMKEYEQFTFKAASKPSTEKRYERMLTIFGEEHLIEDSQSIYNSSLTQPYFDKEKTDFQLSPSTCQVKKRCFSDKHKLVRTKSSELHGSKEKNTKKRKLSEPPPQKIIEKPSKLSSESTDDGFKHKKCSERKLEGGKKVYDDVFVRETTSKKINDKCRKLSIHDGSKEKCLEKVENDKKLGGEFCVVEPANKKTIEKSRKQSVDDGSKTERFSEKKVDDHMCVSEPKKIVEKTRKLSKELTGDGAKDKKYPEKELEGGKKLECDGRKSMLSQKAKDDDSRKLPKTSKHSCDKLDVQKCNLRQESSFSGDSLLIVNLDEENSHSEDSLVIVNLDEENRHSEDSPVIVNFDQSKDYDSRKLSEMARLSGDNLDAQKSDVRQESSHSEDFPVIVNLDQPKDDDSRSLPKTLKCSYDKPDVQESDVRHDNIHSVDSSVIVNLDHGKEIMVNDNVNSPSPINEFLGRLSNSSMETVEAPQNENTIVVLNGKKVDYRKVENKYDRMTQASGVINSERRRLWNALEGIYGIEEIKPEPKDDDDDDCCIISSNLPNVITKDECRQVNPVIVQESSFENPSPDHGVIVLNTSGIGSDLVENRPAVASNNAQNESVHEDVSSSQVPRCSQISSRENASNYAQNESVHEDVSSSQVPGCSQISSRENVIAQVSVAKSSINDRGVATREDRIRIREDLLEKDDDDTPNPRASLVQSTEDPMSHCFQSKEGLNLLGHFSDMIINLAQGAENLAKSDTSKKLTRYKALALLFRKYYHPMYECCKKAVEAYTEDPRYFLNILFFNILKSSPNFYSIYKLEDLKLMLMLIVNNFIKSSTPENLYHMKKEGSELLSKMGIKHQNQANRAASLPNCSSTNNTTERSRDTNVVSSNNVASNLALINAHSVNPIASNIQNPIIPPNVHPFSRVNASLRVEPQNPGFTHGNSNARQAAQQHEVPSAISRIDPEEIRRNRDLNLNSSAQSADRQNQSILVNPSIPYGSYSAVNTLNSSQSILSNPSISQSQRLVQMSNNLRMRIGSASQSLACNIQNVQGSSQQHLQKSATNIHHANNILHPPVNNRYSGSHQVGASSGNIPDRDNISLNYMPSSNAIAALNQVSTPIGQLNQRSVLNEAAFQVNNTVHHLPVPQQRMTSFQASNPTTSSDTSSIQASSLNLNQAYNALPLSSHSLQQKSASQRTSYNPISALEATTTQRKTYHQHRSSQSGLLSQPSVQHLHQSQVQVARNSYPYSNPTSITGQPLPVQNYNHNNPNLILNRVEIHASQQNQHIIARKESCSSSQYTDGNNMQRSVSQIRNSVEVMGRSQLVGQHLMHQRNENSVQIGQTYRTQGSAIAQARAAEISSYSPHGNTIALPAQVPPPSHGRESENILARMLVHDKPFNHSGYNIHQNDHTSIQQNAQRPPVITHAVSLRNSIPLSDQPISSQLTSVESTQNGFISSSLYASNLTVRNNVQSYMYETATDRTRAEIQRQPSMPLDSPVHHSSPGQLPEESDQYSATGVSRSASRDSGYRSPSQGADVPMRIPGKCGVCQKAAQLTCSVCKSVFYCNEMCQREDWSRHKSRCSILCALKT